MSPPWAVLHFLPSAPALGWGEVCGPGGGRGYLEGTLASNDRFAGTAWEVGIIQSCFLCAHWHGSRLFKCLIV